MVKAPLGKIACVDLEWNGIIMGTWGAQSSLFPIYLPKYVPCPCFFTRNAEVFISLQESFQ